jgi:hypothetical protein
MIVLRSSIGSSQPAYLTCFRLCFVCSMLRSSPVDARRDRYEGLRGMGAATAIIQTERFG